MTDSTRSSSSSPWSFPADPAEDGTGVDWAVASTALWREREALERLHFKLVEQQLVLAAGEVRWLHLVDDEVRAAAEAMRAAEILRSAEFEMFARQLNLAPDASLREFIAAAPEPWPTVLDEHRAALHELALDIRATAASNTRMLQAGAKAIRETLEHLSGGESGYDGTGAAAAGPRRALLLDQQA